MPTYDPNASIRLRSPLNVADPSSAPSDVAPALLLTSNLCDLYRPKNPSPLRQVTNALEQPPQKFQHRLTMANLGTPGGTLVGFPRTCQQNLSVPKRVRFRAAEITTPPMPASPTTPTENIPAKAQQPSDPSDVAPSSIVSDENTSLGSFVHTPTVFDRETPLADDFPDSPSVYSPTPPNSSAPSANHLLESLRGLPKSAKVNPPAIDIGHLRPSVEQLLDEGSPSEQHHTGKLSIGEQPNDEDRSASASKDDSRGMTREHVPNRRRGNSTNAPSWWGRVTIVAGSVTLSVIKAWEKKARATAAHAESQGGQRRPTAVTRKEALGRAKDPSQVLIDD